MNRTDLQQLAMTRLAEAEALVAAGFPSGAYYLAGYAIECALKARIASFTQLHEFPDKRKAIESYTHSFRELVKTASLTTELRQMQEADPIFNGSWIEVLGWDEGSRYRNFSQDQAKQLMMAIADQDHGVFQWLKLYW